MQTKIEASQTKAVPAQEFRREVEWLAGLTRDYCAYTESERKTEAFQTFLRGLEQKTRYVAGLYCARSKKQDSFKEMTLETANTILSRHASKPERHLRLVK